MSALNFHGQKLSLLKFWILCDRYLRRIELISMPSFKIICNLKHSQKKWLYFIILFLNLVVLTFQCEKFYIKLDFRQFLEVTLKILHVWRNLIKILKSFGKRFFPLLRIWCSQFLNDRIFYQNKKYQFQKIAFSK